MRNADRGEWLTDKFGMPWQIVPSRLWEWFGDPAKVKRVTGAVRQMQKLDLAKRERARDVELGSQNGACRKRCDMAARRG